MREADSVVRNSFQSVCFVTSGGGCISWIGLSASCKRTGRWSEDRSVRVVTLHVLAASPCRKKKSMTSGIRLWSKGQYVGSPLDAIAGEW